MIEPALLILLIFFGAVSPWVYSLRQYHLSVKPKGFEAVLENVIC